MISFHSQITLLCYVLKPRGSSNKSDFIPLLAALNMLDMISLIFDLNCQTTLIKRIVPYLPLYNARPCMIRTPILDCTLNKKKGRRKERKWLRKNSVKTS